MLSFPEVGTYSMSACPVTISWVLCFLESFTYGNKYATNVSWLRRRGSYVDTEKLSSSLKERLKNWSSVTQRWCSGNRLPTLQFSGVLKLDFINIFHDSLPFCYFINAALNDMGFLNSHFQLFSVYI